MVVKGIIDVGLEVNVGPDAADLALLRLAAPMNGVTQLEVTHKTSNMSDVVKRVNVMNVGNALVPVQYNRPYNL